MDKKAEVLPKTRSSLCNSQAHRMKGCSCDTLYAVQFCKEWCEAVHDEVLSMSGIQDLCSSQLMIKAAISSDWAEQSNAAHVLSCPGRAVAYQTLQLTLAYFWAAAHVY